MCAFLDAPIISIAQGAELLARYGSDVRTAGVVPLELWKLPAPKIPPRSKVRTQFQNAGTATAKIECDSLVTLMVGH
jgi:hypothetical protein